MITHGKLVNIDKSDAKYLYTKSAFDTKLDSNPSGMIGAHLNFKSEERQDVFNIAAAKIQGGVRGYLARKHYLAQIRKECLSLRKLLEEKEAKIFQLSMLVSNKDMTINELRQQVRIEFDVQKAKQEFSLKRTRSSLFAHSDNTVDSISEGFYGVHVSSTESIYPRTLPRASSPTWGSQTDVNLMADSDSVNNDFIRNIWTPVVSNSALITKEPTKSSSTTSLLRADTPPPEILATPKAVPENITISEPVYSAPTPAVSSLPLSEVKELKASFKSYVDKIVKTNDQPCSIYLQQRLKNEQSEEVKALIFDAIMAQVLPLMKNRFGNFLVQCCLECGTLDQFNALCMKMKGHVVHLSSDRFGCHVMQKAIEKLKEDVKFMLIQELYTSIQDTFTNRFACHVWQRIFEVQWSTINVEIMAKVQSVLIGKWAEIANDENGSLIVQCIFEHCKHSEKIPIIQEIFKCTAEISRGQWGNWVIQHLLEHGSAVEQAHIVEVILGNSYLMSNDQYASKVVEKCVKIASKKDLHQFVERLLTLPSKENPNVLAMMNNQFGNYVVQNILSVAESNQRDQCVRLIAPHLPVLRASKYGQRVASLCEKYLRMGPKRDNDF